MSMQSVIFKRSINLNGHKTSVSLEDAFWTALREIARGKAMTTSEMLASIDAQRSTINLSSAIRLYVLAHYKSALAVDAV
jgi:predicted DNA-binding ribbon-helix-helix protein